MSNKLLAIAWKADIPSGKKIILLALCDEADDNGRTNPSVDYLGKKGGLMGRSTVFNHLKDLEIEGFIKRFSTSGKNTIYQIDINKINSTPVQESNPSRMWTSPENGQPVQILDYTRPKSEPLLSRI